MAIAHAQHPTSVLVNGTSAQSNAFASNPTIGNRIIVYLSSFEAATTGFLFSDTAGNTYTVDATLERLSDPGNFERVTIASALVSATGASFKVTATPAVGGTACDLLLTPVEFSGIATSSYLDVTPVTAGVGKSTTSITAGPTAAMNQAGNLLIAIMSGESSLTNESVTNPANITGPTLSTASTSVGVSQDFSSINGGQHSYAIASSTAAASANWTYTSDSITYAQYVAALAVYKPAAAAAALAGTVGVVAAFTGALTVANALSGNVGGVASNLGTLTSHVVATQYVPLANRPRPGRGPFSKGKFFVQRLDAFTPNARLTGTTAAVASNSGSLPVANALSGLTAALASNTGTLGKAIALGGALGGVASTSGTLSNAAALGGGTLAVSSFTGTLTNGSAAAFVGTLGAVASFTGTLSVKSALAGITSALGTNTGALAVSFALSGGKFSVGTFGGNLSSGGATALIGIMGAAANFGGALSNKVALVGATNATASNSGQIANALALGGLTSSIALFSGTLASSQSASFTGSVGAVATWGGGLSNKISLNGLTGSIGQFGGFLRPGNYLIGGPRYIIRRLRARRWMVSASTYLQFDPKGADESVKLTFDFNDDLPSGVTLTGSPTVIFSVATGADTNPSTLSNGFALPNQDSTQIIVPVTGGLAGVTYNVHVRCATTDPELVLSLTGTLPVTA